MKVTLSKKSTLATRIELLTKPDATAIVDFSGDTGEVAVRYDGKTTVIYCGLGDAAVCTAAGIRSAAAKGVQKALELKRSSVSLIVPPLAFRGVAGCAASVEGAVLGSYKFSRYKSDPPAAIATLECAGEHLTAALLKRTEAICTAVMYARDLVNENASIMTPPALAAEAKKLAVTGGLKAVILDEKEIAAKKLHLLKAVGQGSPTPPRLIFLEYRGDAASKKTTLIAGKGITFDSGGQNLKPTGHIETMRMDMAGAAAVLGTMKALAELRPKINVIGCITAAHNGIGERAYFPGDVYPSYAGKTVEICSTDAEGRLVLADAVAYGIKVYRPSRVVDLATLTGGILTTLGELVAGLFSNDDTLASELFASGESTGERLWRFPVYQEYRDSLKSDIADLRNTSKFKKGYASSITGAAFIQEFVGDTPWAHLDIAGTAWNEGGQRGEIPPLGTGFGVRLLVDFLCPPAGKAQ